MTIGRRALISLPKVPAALQRRDFALLWSGQCISMVGDGIFTVALAVEALHVDSRPEVLSFILAARIVPAVCLVLVGGVVVDRVPRRLAMLASDTVRGLAVAVIAAGVAAGHIRLWELLTMAVTFGIGDAFFDPASVAIVPELLPAELLVQGNALTATSQQTAQKLAGPALGGIIAAAFGLAWAFAIDAASFAVSAACLLAMTSRPGRPSSGRSMLAEARQGLRYCWSQQWLWVAMLAAAIANLAAYAPLAVLIPVLIRGVMHESPLALGLVLTSGGAGGVLASLIIGRMGAPRLHVTAMWVSWGAAGGAVAGLAFAPGAWVAGLLVAVVWGLVTYGNVLWTPMMQERVPASLLGRVASVEWLASFVGGPVGVVLAGVAAGTTGPRASLLVGGSVAALIVLGVLVPGVRDPERRPDPPPATASAPGPV